MSIKYQRNEFGRLKEEFMKEHPVILELTRYKDNVRAFHAKQPFFYDHAGIFWIWNFEDTKWETIDDTDILNCIENTLRLSGEIITPPIKANYLEALRRVGRECKPKDAPVHWVQFRSEYADLQNNYVQGVKPNYFFTNPIPHDIGKSSDTPNIDRIFKEWVGDSYVKTLYEITAYCMYRDYPMHLIFCFVGSGLNGKSKFLEFLTRFIGEDNICTTELDTLLHSRFEVTKLHKKLVCIMGETDFSTLRKTSMIKKLTGQDMIGYEYKHKTPFSDHNYAKILIATNTLPVTEDKSRGYYRRWFLVDFPNEFTEKKDILAEIPSIEYSNLARKCLEILYDLLNTRQFTNQGTVDERQKRYETKSNHVAKFITERCIVDSEAVIPFTEFYSVFSKYCIKHKLRPLSAIIVGKLLTAEGFERGTKSIQIRTGEDERKTTTQKVIHGLRFKVEKQEVLAK